MTVPSAAPDAPLAEKIAAARVVQCAWAALPFSDRAGYLQKSFRYLAAHIDETAAAICRENGKLPLDALIAEVIPALMGIDYYLRAGKRFCKSRPVSGGNPLMFNKKSRLVYQPWGIIGIISPWNYPFAIPFSEVVMALLAGNAVFLKIASVTPGVGRALEAVFAAAELPRGLFNLIELPGAQAGPAFISLGVDKLFFTGSTATGQELMALAAPRLVPLVLELGGADAAIVCADADIERAARGILWAAFSNAGQSCGGVQRILVNRKIYAPFLETITALVKSLRPGHDLGPMTTLRQKETVERQAAACLASGAEIAAQSPRAELGDPRFFPATLLVNVTPEMPIMTEEVFGPVAAVIPVDNDSDALRAANASPYSLTGSIWSRSLDRARRLAPALNAGSVMINDHLMSHGLAETPWGGFGRSGLGKTHGEAGFREMQKLKVVIDDTLPGARGNPWWYPYTEHVERGMRAIAELSRGAGFPRRLTAFFAAARFFLRYWEKRDGRGT
ncbi:MAG: aldehyde dehydrogenase family protein [Spirochaetaceae bacterium]|jgi:succinate-semialdehyde dehydrogenase/glutarate-semialdehyde dehydrogenase|nr:aldehyde dehydrogenase family protein [Spirochaetaceae bacterium]